MAPGIPDFFLYFYENLALKTNQHIRELWLSGRVHGSRLKRRGFEPHRCHCVVSLSKNINPSLVLVQPRKTRPFITERLLMGRKEANQKHTKYAKKELIDTQFLRAAQSMYLYL